jgi:hypothetical protein
MEQEDVFDTRNLLSLAHMLFLLFCAAFLSSKLVMGPDSSSLVNAHGHPANLANVRTPLGINVVYTP